MKISTKKLPWRDPIWFPVCAAVLILYLYLCFAYNLQFYTEDERYVQLDMTNLASLYQWGMTNYRVSSSFGCFIYYPLTFVLEIISKCLVFLLGSEYKLLLIPIMVSKLSHSIMAFAGWLWFIFEAGRILNKKWGITPWCALLCLLFTAMLPVNIFLVKINNYDSIYNILCLVGGIYFYRYILSNDVKELGGSFVLFALAMQEKFAAYPIFMVFLVAVPFIIKRKGNLFPLKEVTAIIAGIVIGSLLPSAVRALSEIFWGADSSILHKHLWQYKPFLTFPKALGTAKHFVGINAPVFSTIIQYSFVLHIIGFGLWTSIITFIRKKNDFSVFKEKEVLRMTVMGIIQVLFLFWAFASAWYTPPESGTYPFDTPSPGTYIPAHLTDSHPTFYNGAGHLEYIFIRMIGSVGFFKPMMYSPIFIMLLLGPAATFFSLRVKDERFRSLVNKSAFIFNWTMIIVVMVSLTGVPFGGRYANIYLTLLGVSVFLNVLALSLFCSVIKRLNSGKVILTAVIICSTLFTAELIPYGPSYQQFGNLFYPNCRIGGWGEPTSTLVQAAVNDPFLKNALGKTYTTYTGLAIEKPFFTPLINLRLIRSRNPKIKGKRRVIQYMLAERTAIGQNPWLRNVLEVAKGVDGAIVWEAKKGDCTSAWLIDFYKLGLYDYQEQINPDKVERHYRGEWFF